jgi:hypothetical protein
MAVYTTWDTSTNKDVFKTLVKDVFDNTDKPAWTQWKEVMREVQSKDYYERYMRMAGLDLAKEKTQGTPMYIQDPKFGSTKDFTQAEWSTGFKFGWMLKETNKYNLAEKWTRNLKKVMLETKDIIVARIYNYPTATTYCSGFDGLALAHDSHTCLDDAASTYDNKTTSGLSVTSLQSAYIYFRTLKNDQGQRWMVAPDKLIIPPELEFTAKEITGSSLVAHELSNTTNVLREKGINVFVYSRLTDTNDWFLAATKEDDFGPMVISLRDPHIFTHDSYDDALDTVVGSHEAFTYGFLDPRLVYCGIVT